MSESERDRKRQWRRFLRMLDKGELRLPGSIFKELRGERVPVVRARHLPSRRVQGRCA